MRNVIRHPAVGGLVMVISLIAATFLGAQPVAGASKPAMANTTPAAEEAKPAAESANAPDQAPAATGDTQTKSDYQIVPQDLLVVDVVGEKELMDREFRVSANGEITYPYIERIKVGGLATAEVEKIIKEKLDKDFIINPQVNVRVKEYSLRFITVTGEVNKPGAVEMKGETKWTIVDAIAQAGGPTKAAKTSKIQFTRKGVTKKFNLDDLKKTSDPGKIIWIEPGDVIHVPGTFF